MGRLAGFHTEIIRKLRSRGFEFDRQAAGSHEIWFNARTNRYTALPNHPGDMPEGMLRAILKQAGIVDSDVRFGKPCIRGHRITVQEILEWLSGGASQEQILADYPQLEPSDFLAVYAYGAARLTMRPVPRLRKRASKRACRPLVISRSWSTP